MSLSLPKLVVCSAVSVALVAVLLLAVRAGWPDRAERASGERYWEVVLKGRGRELTREGDRVYFFRQHHHGWWYQWVSRDETEKTIAPAFRAYLDDWFRFRKLLAGEVPEAVRWEKRLLELLSGRSLESEGVSPKEWWDRNRERFSPTAEQASAFLRERNSRVARACRLRRSRSADSAATLDDTYVFDTSMHLVYLYSPEIDEAVAEWAPRGRGWLNFHVEVVYYPILVFYLAYALPAVARRMGARSWRRWSRYAVLGALVHLGLVLPYALGYSPSLFSTRGNQGTLFYNIGLMLAEIPTVLLLSLLPESVVGVVAQLALPLHYLFYPVLSRFNQPGTSFLIYSTFASRGLIILVGTIAYAGCGVLLSLLTRLTDWARTRSQAGGTRG